MPTATPIKKKPGRPPKPPDPSLIAGLHNLDTGEPYAHAEATPTEETPEPQATPLRGKWVDVMTTGQMMGATGYGSPALSDLKAQGVIHSIANGQWPAVVNLSAMVKRLRERQEKFGNSDKARKTKADADKAEIEAAIAAQETCLIAHAKQFWTDARIDIRRTIEKAEYIPAPLRERLLLEIAGLKEHELGANENE